MISFDNALIEVIPPLLSAKAYHARLLAKNLALTVQPATFIGLSATEGYPNEAIFADTISNRHRLRGLWVRYGGSRVRARP